MTRRKQRAEPPGAARLYWQKSQRFARAARANAAANEHDPAVANAVNAAINLADAVAVHYLGHRNASDAHDDALILLASTDLDPNARARVLRHFENLLNLKNVAQYESRLLDENDSARALQHLDRMLEALRPLVQGWGS